MLQLAKEIVAGRRLTSEDDLTRLVTADLSELCQGTDCKKTFAKIITIKEEVER